MTQYKFGTYQELTLFQEGKLCSCEMAGIKQFLGKNILILLKNSFFPAQKQKSVFFLLLTRIFPDMYLKA